ncbi:Uncharacterised protein family (UPF0259) [Pseudomonas segetis]|uniref:Uncharacterized protein family (UPF0259) n=2 Tax=Pseudomonas segetis TaxID=298908 RepID=A0A239H2P3_9PSED|nr:Uncharacterised protein family (UPF0259) [Pseudomonas segetis]
MIKTTMNITAILRDSWFFFSNNLLSIAKLCLPLILVESLLHQWVSSIAGPENEMIYGIMLGLVFYPLYTGALILFLDARSRNESPQIRNLLATSLSMWPAFALLTAISTLVIALGASLFIIPGLWFMIKLAFAEYLLVLRGLSPIKALHESFELTRNYFWQIAGCVLIVMVPLWLLSGWLQTTQGADADGLFAILLNSTDNFLQLFASVVLFRMFMLHEQAPIEN